MAHWRYEIQLRDVLKEGDSLQPEDDATFLALAIKDRLQEQLHPEDRVLESCPLDSFHEEMSCDDVDDALHDLWDWLDEQRIFVELRKGV